MTPRACADVLFERVLRDMQAAPAPKVKLIYTAQGVFAKRKLQEQLEGFLTRAAQRGPRT